MGKRPKQKEYTQRARKREYRESVNRSGNDFGGQGKASFDGERNGGNNGWTRFKEAQMLRLPERLPRDPSKKLVEVFVEGYEDIAFWRGIFDIYESQRITFEVSVPPREDLAKGKKVVMGMIEEDRPGKLLCVDSDFDYLFGDMTEQSHMVNNTRYLFHTYAYATENFLCYAPSLHNVCVKATKNDARIFDFEKFLIEYSRIIYPLFLWYAYSARLKSENIFTLVEFKSSVKLNYMEVEENGHGTLRWLERQVGKRLGSLHRNHPDVEERLFEFESKLAARGLRKDNTYMFMQGHTLMDNVVMVMLNAVCEQLKLMSNIMITTSTKTGTALKNEMSNYNNSLRGIRDVLLDNESYKESPLYNLLRRDIETYLATLKL